MVELQLTVPTERVDERDTMFARAAHPIFESGPATPPPGTNLSASERIEQGATIMPSRKPFAFP